MIDKGRRRILSGLGGAALYLAVQDLLAQGKAPRGVARVRGDASVNGVPAKRGMVMRPGDTVITGRNGEIVFVIGKDAMLVRADSQIETQGAAGALVTSGFRVVTGAILSVFGPGEPKTLVTSTATIGIRGTGIYIESGADRTYVCTCYGEAELASRGDPAVREVVKTRHHEQPRYIMATGAPQMLMSAPVINHTDAELAMLEGLVGRKTPFAGKKAYSY
jgi:hypothetical protein